MPKQGYVLSAQGNLYPEKHDLNLEIMVEGDDLLLIIYHKVPQRKTEGAKALSGFLKLYEKQVWPLSVRS